MPTDVQRRTAEAIVNIFETGSARGDYTNVTVTPGDPGHLTYGRSQTTLPSGNLYLLVKSFVETPGAATADALAPFLGRLQSRDLALDHDMTLRGLLKQAGADPVMRSVQDAFFDEVYWTPAQRAAPGLGIATALGTAVVYDSTVHGSFKLIRDRTGAAGATGGVQEEDWITRYIATRREWLANHQSVPLLRKTVYRMDELGKLAAAGNWDLDLPIDCRGVRIDASVVGGAAERISAHIVEERLLSLRVPMMQGDDVMTIQTQLVQKGAADLAPDGVFGAATERAVIEFQRRAGLSVDGIVGPGTRSALESPAQPGLRLAAE